MNTREEWLEKAVELQRSEFEEVGATLPPSLGVSCSWPSVGRGKVIGECWRPGASSRGYTEIFISPTLEDPLAPQGVLATLRHELVHASGLMGHGKDFKEVAEMVGLTGKMTSTHASPELLLTFEGLTKALGPYPHGALSGAGYIIAPGPDGKPIILTPSDRPRKQGTRLLKAACPRCGYTIRLSKLWADRGLPHCPLDETLFRMDESLGVEAA